MSTREDGDHHLCAASHAETDGCAALQARALQAARETVGAPVQLRIGERVAIAGDRHVIGCALGLALEQLVNAVGGKFPARVVPAREYPVLFGFAEHRERGICASGSATTLLSSVR